MLALLLLLWLIQPTPGVSSIELNASDPQNINSQLIWACVEINGSCAVWYAPGTYHVTRPIYMPVGVKDVYLAGVTLIPCSPEMWRMFEVPDNGGVPVFHDLEYAIDDSKPCGGFVPPIKYRVRTPGMPPPAL